MNEVVVIMDEHVIVAIACVVFALPLLFLSIALGQERGRQK